MSEKTNEGVWMSEQAREEARLWEVWESKRTRKRVRRVTTYLITGLSYVTLVVMWATLLTAADSAPFWCRVHMVVVLIALPLIAYDLSWGDSWQKKKLAKLLGE